MRRYELMLLFRPDLEDDQLQAAVERVTRAIVNAGGGLTKISPWGKRRLAYPIQHHRDASYFLIHFDIEPAAVREIERGLLISEEILRHLVVVLEPRRARLSDAGDGGESADAEVDLAPPPPIDELKLGADDETDEADTDVTQTDTAKEGVNADVTAPEEVAR